METDHSREPGLAAIHNKATTLLNVPLPAWFLENCVETTEELADADTSICVDDGDSNDLLVSSRNKYEVSKAVYESLLTLMKPQPCEDNVTSDGEELFWYDIVYSCFPGKDIGGATRSFLSAAIQQFARDVKADFIRLSADDIIDLLRPSFGNAHHASNVWTRDHRSYKPQHSMRQASEGREDPNSGEKNEATPGVPLPSPEVTREPGSRHYVTGLLEVRNEKRLRNKRLPARASPLIVHLNVADDAPGYEGRQMLIELYQTTIASRGRALLILTIAYPGSSDFVSRRYDYDYNKRDFSSYLNTGISSDISFAEKSAIGVLRLRETPVFIAPKRTQEQQDLMKQHQQCDSSFEYGNIRFLQRSIMGVSHLHQDVEMLQPYARWHFLEGTSTQRVLKDRQLRESEIEDLLHVIPRGVADMQHIRSAILHIGLRDDMLHEWTSDRAQDPDEIQCGVSKHVQAVMKQIKNDKKLEKEASLLAHLVDPTEVNQGLAHVAVDSETKLKITRIVKQLSKGNKQGYGLLRQGYMDGVLLYGPPGTGKTHVARAIAYESSAVMLSISPAEIEHKFVGETENAVKALFNLGHMLYPSVIFFDEADSLFARRGHDDRSWERNRVNQLLHEIDGLNRSSRKPFIILATNLPEFLDEAVLRRVPGRIYIGLPSKPYRTNIFEICLQEEQLDKDVNLDELALQTMGYSGSDIRNVCIQAAQSSEDELVDVDGTRILTKAHFQRALQMVHRTTSEANIANFKTFAQTYDPSASNKLEAIAEQKRRFIQFYSRGYSRTDLKPAERYLDSVSAQDKATPTSTKDLTSLEHLRTHFIANPDPPPPIKSITNSVGRPDIEAQLPFEYLRLKPNSNEMRVLSIESRQTTDTSDKPNLLHCKLKTVDLDAWSNFYTFFTRKYKDSTHLEEPRDLLFLWRRLEGYIQSDGTIKTNSLLSELRDETHCGHRRSQNLKAFIPRFSWGDYITLSYVWGTEQPSEEILLDGRRFLVRPNLYSALLQLRESAEVKDLGLYVWVDAISINQSDTVERENEVKKMSVIFSRGRKVVAWLGQSVAPAMNDDVLKVLQLISHMGGAKGKQSAERCWRYVSDIDALQSILSVGEFVLNNTYWERVWIMQEMCLAPYLIFWIGEYEFGLSALSLLFTMFMAASAAALESIKASPTPWAGSGTMFTHKSMALVRWNTRWLDHIYSGIFGNRSTTQFLKSKDAARSWDTYEIVKIAQSSKATDSRDLIYGLLALLHEEMHGQMKVSYAQGVSANDVYTSFMKACISTFRNLNILKTISGEHVPNDTLRKRPTWIPDLDNSMWKGPRFMDTRAVKNNFSANRTLPQSEIVFSSDDRYISCQGVIIDSFGSLGAARAPSVPTNFVAYERTGPSTEEQQDSCSCAERGTEGQKWPNDTSLSLRLSLARVLTSDPELRSTMRSTVLDFPWLDEEELSSEMIESSTLSAWVEVAGPNQILDIYKMFLWPNQDFTIGKCGLKDYFSHDAGNAHVPIEKRSHIVHDLVGLHMQSTRLFTSKKGILGTAPFWTKLDDYIVVLAQCDTPLVLRFHPERECYGIVGKCYVDGFMLGEAAEEVSKGHLEVAHLTIG